MPPQFVNLGASANPDLNLTTNISNYSGTSWTPPTQGLLIVDVFSAVTAATPNIPTPQGNKLQFYTIKSVLMGASNFQRLTRFGANLTGSVAGVTGFDFAGQSQLCCRASFYYVSGTSVDLTNGVTGSFVQSPTNTGNSASGTVTLAAAGNPNNRPIVAFAHNANEATAPKVNWTELDDLAGTAPVTDLETQYQGDAFETVAAGGWASSSQWGAIASEIKAVVQAQSYEDSVSISRKDLVSDQGSLGIFASSSISRKDGVSDGAANSVLGQMSTSERDAILNSLLVGLGGSVQLSEVMSFLNQNNATLQASISTLSKMSESQIGNLSILANSSLSEKLSVNLLGGLSFVASMSLSEALALSEGAGLGIFSATSIGEKTGFSVINAVSLGASVGISDSLGMGGSANLSAQAQASLRKSLGITDSASISMQSLANLAKSLGMVYSAKTTIQAFINVSKKTIILFDASVTTNAIFVIMQTLSEKLGLSSSAQLDARPSFGIGEKVSFLGGNTAIMDVGSGMGIIYSVVTVGDTNVIIIKGFVFTSDFASSTIAVSGLSASALTSDHENSNIKASDT